MEPAPTSPRPPAFLLVAAVLALAVGWLYASGVDRSRSWGWDESMHAGLPAERIALALGAGAGGELADVIHGCMQYPFVWPLVVGVVHSTGGAIEAPVAARGGAVDIETEGRRLGRWSLALMLFGLVLLGRECWRGTRSPWGLFLAPLLALCSPLLIDYSGSWFLEAPFAALLTFTLFAWARRARLVASAAASTWSARTIARDLCVGSLIALAFFTKFNYGLLLGFGLFLDLVLDLGLVLRGRGIALRDFLATSACLALVPLLAFAWWFLLPLPFGGDIAVAHREAFLAFLGGNQALVRTPDSLRLLHWTTSFVASLRLFLFVLVGLGASLVFCLRQLRCGCASARNQLRLWLVLLAMGLPIATHNFHLDRFLVVLLPPVAVLATTGWSALLAAALGRRFGFESKPTRLAPLGIVVVLVALSLVGRSWDGRLVFDATVGFQEKPDVRAYQEQVLAEFQSLAPGRPIATAGLDRGAADALLALVVGALEKRSIELGHPATFAWLGISAELSPAALHIGVHDRTGEAERLRRDAATVRGDGNPSMVMTFEGIDPGWNDDQLFGWARSFDLVFTSVPPDLRGRGSRDFVRGYQERLIGSGLVVPAELGTVNVLMPMGPAKSAKLFALTPTPPSP